MKLPAASSDRSSGSALSMTLVPQVDLGFKTFLVSFSAHRVSATMFHGTLQTQNQTFNPPREVEVPWTAEHKGSHWIFLHGVYKTGKILGVPRMNDIVLRELTVWLNTHQATTGPIPTVREVEAPKKAKSATRRERISSENAATAARPNPPPVFATRKSLVTTYAEELLMKAGHLPPKVTAVTAVTPAPAPIPTPAQTASSTREVTIPQGTPSDELLESATILRRVPVHLIRPNPKQPRHEFIEADQEDLSASIREEGQNTPIEIVMNAPGTPTPFMIVKGERRWRSFNRLGERYIDAIIRTTEQIPDDVAAHMWCIIGDYHQAQYSKVDLIRAIAFQFNEGKKTLRQLATHFRKSVTWVENQVHLGRLHPDLLLRLNQRLPKKEQLPVEVAKYVARVPSEQQFGIYDQVTKIVGNKLKISEARRLSAEIVPIKSKRVGKSRPAERARNILSRVPNINAEARQINGYDELTIRSLVTHHPTETAMLVPLISDAITQLEALKAKLVAAQKPTSV